MPEITLAGAQCAGISASYASTNFSTETSYVSGGSPPISDILFSFAAPPEAARFKAIENVTVYTNYQVSYSAYAQSIAWYYLKGPFNEKTVTYNNKPSYGGTNLSVYVSSAGYKKVGSFTSSIASSVLKYGIMIATNYYWSFQSTRSSNPPYATFRYTDETVGLAISNTSPSRGSIVAANSNTFSWRESVNGYCYADVSRTSAKFRWRKSASDTVKEIAVPGTATSITIPANTFSGDSIQWQLSVTANSGVTTTSDWMTLSLTDVESTAVAVAPDRAVIDGASDNVFKWEHVISTGTAQTKAELQQSTDGSTWTALATVTGAANTWTAPAGTFTSGTKYWRVRTYNSKGAAGAWSAATQFIVLAAPATPPVSIVSTEPRPESRWQSDGQQAYQVEIDGVYASGTRFGTGKTWKAPFYLADGSYTVRVRVQNEYGFWSPWGTAALPVTNVPGGAITLTAEGGIEAVLNWTPGSFDYYLVYRDGVAIAKVTEPSYTDAASIGGVRYQVRGCYDNSDNYSLSEAVEVTVSTDKVRLYDMERGEWLHFLYES